MQRLTPQLSSSEENVFILLNQVISLDKFPRGRVGRPKNLYGFFFVLQYCFCKKKKNEEKKGLTAYTGK